MAFQLKKEGEFELNRTWEGEKTRAEFEFSFPNLPLISEVVLIQQAIKASSITIRDKYLRYTIEEDTAPRPNRFRVKVWLAGAPQREVQGTIDGTKVSYQSGGQVGAAVGALPLLAVVAIGLVIAVIVGTVVFKILKETGLLGVVTNPFVLLAGLGLVAGYLIFGRKKGEGG